MSEHDDEREAERLYRELPREEPPPALDAKLRAEARRALVAHPAPLVAPTGRRNWYFPVAAAAVIVLAVAVTWQVEREQGDPVTATPESVPAPELREENKLYEKKEMQKQETQKQPEPQKPAPLAKRAEKPATRMAEKPAAAPFAADSGAAGRAEAAKPQEEAKNRGPAEPAAGALAAPRDREEAYARREDRARQERPAAAAPPTVGRRGLESGAVVAQMLGRSVEENPQQWLEHIAQFRQQGRHDDADKALAEFRKRYPDYKISEAMLEKVEKR